MMNFSKKLLLPTFINPNKPKAVLTLTKRDSIYGYVINGEQVAEAESIDLHKTAPIYYGGPLKYDNLKLLHKFPDIETQFHHEFDGIHAFQICKNVYFGTPTGLMNIYKREISKDFMLLSGNLEWTQERLKKEIDYGFWEVEDLANHDIFDRNAISQLAIQNSRQKLHKIMPSLN
jgi:putative AlgH/UPF0301 family transcriptional regulator